MINMTYIIEFKYGERVSGILPEEYDTEIEAQDACDYENKQYNNVHHFVKLIKTNELKE